MKKLFLVGVMALMGVTAVNAQTGNFKVGAHLGLPVGELSDGYSVSAGADLAYTFSVAENFKAGITTGYSHYFGKEIELNLLGTTLKENVPDFGIIPVAATVEYSLAPQFYVGGDIGYAFLIDDSSDTGAFYYQPKAGYRFGTHELYVGYKGLSGDGESASSINLGYAFTFGK